MPDATTSRWTPPEPGALGNESAWSDAPESERAAWLAERRQLVTASDAAAILGVDPWRGPFAVYLEKAEGVERERTPEMARGLIFEGAIAEAYALETGRPIASPGAYRIARHPEHAWLGATLDRTTLGSDRHPAPRQGPGALEVKMVAAAKRSEWQDEPPAGYQVQLQMQMACADLAWGALVALIGGVELRWYDATPNPSFLAQALPVLERFHRQVEARDPPEADGLPSTSAAIKALYADEDGNTVTLDGEALEMMVERERLKTVQHIQEEKLRRIDNQLRARLGACSFGLLPDGSYVTLKTTTRDGYTVAPTSYRQLRRWWPKVKRNAHDR